MTKSPSVKKISVVKKSHATLGAAILKVVELHIPLGPEYVHSEDCMQCNDTWPCETVRTIIETLEEDGSL